MKRQRDSEASTEKIKVERKEEKRCEKERRKIKQKKRETAEAEKRKEEWKEIRREQDSTVENMNISNIIKKIKKNLNTHITHR